MSDPVAIKTSAFNVIKGALEPAGFTVTRGWSNRNPPRVWCYLGDITWPSSEWATNRSRQYTMSFPIVLNALFAKSTVEDAEAFLNTGLAALTLAFNADSSVRDSGVITWMLSPSQMGVQPHTDGLEAQGVFMFTADYRPEQP